MIKAVFFDWGDTFVSGFDANERVDNLLKQYNLTWDTLFPYWRSIYILRSSEWIKSDEEMFSWLRKILQKEDIPFEKLRDIRVDSYVIPKENIEVVKELKKDYKVGILSNNVKEWVETILKKYKIEDLFDSVIISSEIGVRKPDARIYYAALKSLSVKPEETVFISDEVADDLVAAKGCGMKTIWLDTNVENEWRKTDREIAKIFKPDTIVKNLKEVISVIKAM